MRCESAVLSHVGLVRSNNEDAFFADDRRCVYAVADGMGGHSAGERASAIAIDTFARAMAEAVPVAHLDAVFAMADRRIHESMDASSHGMGTTLTVCGISSEGMLYAGHVGDSTLHILRAGAARKITQDQSSDHALLNCLGARRGAFVGVAHYQEQLHPDDVVVLASDGLGDALMKNRFRETTDPGALCNGLVQFALMDGGPDNITVICVRVR